MKKNNRSFIIEGNIGAGKSTFLSIIKNICDIQVVPEPVEMWQSITKSENLLDTFYKDPNRWAYTFQSYAFLTRIMTQKKMQKKLAKSDIQILERSIYSDRYCFASNCFDLKMLNTLEWDIYKNSFDWLVDVMVDKPAGFIYLQTTPERCLERLKKRNRQEEKMVGLDYLQKLHIKHEEWLIKKIGVLSFLKKIPVLVIDADKEFESDLVFKNELIKQIKNFIDGALPIAKIKKREKIMQ